MLRFAGPGSALTAWKDGCTGEGKYLQSLVLLSSALCLVRSIWILTVISLIIGFMFSNEKVIYQTHVWNQRDLFEKTCLCI